MIRSQTPTFVVSALLLFALGSACGPNPPGDTGTDADTGTDTTDTRQGPAIENVSITENPNNALSAYVNVETDVTTRVRVDVVRDGDVVFSRQSTDKKKSHEVFVMGMYADTEHEIAVEATDGPRSAMEQKTYTTSPLPDGFPPLQVKTSNPDIAADGYRLMDAFRWKKNGGQNTHGSVDDWGMAIAVDEHGKPVWYYRADHQVWDISRTSRGTLVYNSDPHSIVEIDMTGKILNEWKAKEDLGRELSNDEFAVHHGVSPQGEGTFLTLSTEMRKISGYKETGKEASVVGDVALEFNRSGDVVGTWSMFDVLSDYTTRKRVGSTGPYWDEHYGDAANDWTHGNAVEAGDTEGTLIASLRHQDWVVKWDKETGELLWRLGPEGDFEFPQGSSGKFNYHQHAPEWLGNGNLLVYDNGNARPTISEGNQFYTRVVEYSLDASNVDIGAGDKGTVEQVWAYRSDPKFYAPYVGDADPLPNGNILIGDGGLLEDPSMCIKFDQQGEVVDQTGKCIASQNNLKWARILEVTHDQAKEKALEVWMRDTSSDPRSYTMYRSSYLEKLAP